jgi:hypothetical protein
MVSLYTDFTSGLLVIAQPLGGQLCWLWTYYRRFTSIFGFADLAKPLTKVTDEKQAFHWIPEVEAGFQTLKEVLYTVHFLLTCSHCWPDSSNVGSGGELPEVQDGQGRIITYCIRLWIMLREITASSGCSSWLSWRHCNFSMKTRFPPAHQPFCLAHNF